MTLVTDSVESVRRLEIPALAVAGAGELASLEEKLERERLWYPPDAFRFETYEDVEAAFKRGHLVRIHDNRNIELIDRFVVNPAEHRPYLTFGAWAMHLELGQRWRSKLDEGGIEAADIRVAATSMTRPLVQEAKIIASGNKLAVPKSTHGRGDACDYDASGYYLRTPEGRIAVGHPGRKLAQDILRARILKELGLDAVPVYSYDYHEIFTQALIEVAREMHQEGRVNLVEEFSGTHNACIHMAASPDYATDSGKRPY